MILVLFGFVAEDKSTELLIVSGIINVISDRFHKIRIEHRSRLTLRMSKQIQDLEEQMLLFTPVLHKC